MFNVCREPLPHLTFDVELLGDCDRIVNQLCLMLAEDSWATPVHSPLLSQHTGMPVIPSNTKDDSPENVKDNGKLENITKEQEGALEKVSDDKSCELENNTNEYSVQGVEMTTEPSTSKNNYDNEENQNRGEDSDDEGEEWKVKSLSDYIPAGQFLYLPPSRYSISSIC